MFYKNREIMFSDLKDYHNTEGKRIVDELTAEEI
jgi:hypothetical protein